VFDGGSTGNQRLTPAHHTPAEMFIAALGGTLKLIADFGDEQLKIA
jgi:hypothetical protein